MVTKAHKTIDREGLIAAICKAVEANGGKRISFVTFAAESKLTPGDLKKHFANWTGALEAAGFTFDKYNTPIPSGKMLEDWGRVARKLRRMPSRHEYILHGDYAATTFRERFGKWSKVPEAFLDFAQNAPEWADVLALLLPEDAPDKACLRKKFPASSSRPRRDQRGTRRFGDRPVCGPPLDFCGLRHAPANELGVVFLFGAMARSIGFVVESFQAGFPDCEAKRLTGPDMWQSVRIEFEYESRNYRQHCHAADGCDFIVCWVHNWDECPKNIEVIALSEHVARLAA